MLGGPHSFCKMGANHDAYAKKLEVSQYISGSSDFPLEVFDTDFLSSLLVVVEPFTLLQIDS